MVDPRATALPLVKVLVFFIGKGSVEKEPVDNPAIHSEAILAARKFYREVDAAATARLRKEKS